MATDELSQKEFHVLSVLINAEASGRELHTSVNAEVNRISGPGFYKMLARLEKAGYVEYRTEKVEVNGHKVREHRYSITGAGQSVFHDTARYYALKGGLIRA